MKQAEHCSHAYQQAFEASLDAIVCSDETGLITLWNPSAGSMFGYSAKEALGQPLIMLMPASDQKKHTAGFNQFISSGKSVLSGSIIEVTGLRKNGATLPVELSLSSRKTADGWAFTAVLRDTSKRKQVEQQLQAIARLSAQATGDDFFRVLVASVARALCVKVAFVAEFISNEPASARSLAIWVGKGLAENMQWTLSGTPCEQVAKGKSVFFADGVQAAFPNDQWLSEVGVDSYLGIPILNNEGHAIGHVGIMDSHSITEQQQIKKILQIFADRAAAELERKHAETLVKKTAGVLEMIATGQPASAIYDAIALMYEARHPGMRCSMLELRGNRLKHGGAPSLPEEYCDAVDGLQNGPDVGSCGASTYTGKRVLVEDIATDPKWTDLKGFALPHGLRCCWSEPIKRADRKVLGAFGMYYNHPALPNENELIDLDSAAKLTAIVMEREFREASVRQLSSAIEQAGESIVITDREGVIEYANPAFTTLTGYSAEEAIGQTPRLLKSGNQDAAFYEEMWDTITNGKVWHGKVIDRKKDGSFYPVTLTISPIFDDSGDITHYTHFVGIQSDLSKLEDMEHRFQQAQKMEAIGTLVGGIAHDFNNMLASMNGHLYLAKGRSRAMPDVVHHLDSIESIAFRAADMIQQLLTFARKDMVSIKQMPLNPFLRETLKLLSTSVPENIDMRQDICDEALQINGDSTQLHQVLLNLINNARDAVEGVDKPAITIRLQSFQADAAFIEHHPYVKEQSYAHVSVADNGTGIPEFHIEHLFEPFFTTKEQGKGTGLGLSMVFGAIKTHHGFVEVESNEGKGSSFHLYIPLLQVEKIITPPAKEAKVARGHGELILLVDDEPGIVETGEAVLETLGYRVLTANNGQQAVEIFEQHAEEIDLCILDMIMPVMGGDQAAKSIRQIKPQIKIIFSTGYDKHMLAGMEHEAVLTKPFPIEDMSWLIRQQLNAEP